MPAPSPREMIESCCKKKDLKRQRQNGTVFYVNAEGHEIDEATAKKWSRAEVKVGESRQRVIELSEAAPPRIPQKEERARQKESRTRLEEAFKRPGMFGGMSDTEARIAAKGRQL